LKEARVRERLEGSIPLALQIEKNEPRNSGSLKKLQKAKKLILLEETQQVSTVKPISDLKL
jgi:hypothetical protein